MREEFMLSCDAAHIVPKARDDVSTYTHNVSLVTHGLF
jgi:hypothetical protein